MNYSISFKTFEHGLIRERLNDRKDIKLYLTCRVIASGLNKLMQRENSTDTLWFAIMLRSKTLVLLNSDEVETPVGEGEKINQMKLLFRIPPELNRFF